MPDEEPATDLPLAGIRVLDAACFIAAPFTASIMSEFGAEVIKVEHPAGGDPWRRYGTATEVPDCSLAWLTEARNRRSITLDLSRAEGAGLFLELVRGADVVCENFRPGKLEAWGLGWEALSAANPGLVMLRVSGYGQSGPYRDRPGFARIAHAYGGLTYLSGMPGEIPVTPGSTSLGDYMTGMYGCIGVLLALRHRDRTGDGQVVDCALYESVFRALDEIAPRYVREGFVREAEGTGTVNACPHGHFTAGDGAFLAIACTTDKMFERLTRAMERPDLLARYAGQAARLAGRDEVLAEVEAWTLSMPRDRVLALCTRHGVPAGPVNSIADIVNDPHVRARGTLASIEVPGIGSVTVPAALPQLSRTPGSVKSLGPRLGADNMGVYRDELGLTEDRIHQLQEAGII